MKCKICGALVKSIVNQNLRMLVPNFYPLSGDISLNVCTECQFVSNFSSTSELDYSNYYINFNKHHLRGERHRILDRLYFERICKIIAENLMGGLENRTILDFGSGAFLFNEVAKSFGVESVTNFDIGGPKPSGTFDVVISTHVFEHIFEPMPVLVSLTELVKESGMVLIAVPDLERYDDLYYGPYSNFDLEHINHFSTSSLTKLFELAGLEMILVDHQERRVAPNLSYAEVLVLGRKSGTIRTEDRSSFDADKCIKELFVRFDKDMEVMNCGFNGVLEKIERLTPDCERAIVLYGLSSYAFRFLNMLKFEGFLQFIDVFADSDSRLKGLQFPGGSSSIIDKESFVRLQSEFDQNAKKLFVIVAAINSGDIVEMFRKEFPNISVEVLPPLTMNRWESLN